MTAIAASLPEQVWPFMDWPWSRIEPYFRELETSPLNTQTVGDWLAVWSHLSDLIEETFSRLQVATTVNTADANAEKRYHAFLDEVFTPSQAAGQRLKERLLTSGLQPDGFDLPLRHMRAEAELYREANLPLLTEERKLGNEFDKIIGAQTVSWDGRELTLPQLQPVYQETDRARREGAWRAAAARQLADRAKINGLWVRFLNLRRQMAANADEPEYRSFRWKQLLRFDYTPADCARFHDAIAEAVVPAASRIYERRRRRLGVERLRPWDLAVDPGGRQPLRPFADVGELIDKTQVVFDQLDPRLAGYYRTMREEKLLDLDNRKNKAPGGYCTDFPVAKRPFIFMNAVGVNADLQTLLHEAGHSFHTFERTALPYTQQREVPMEFAEVASMAMELLAAPYLAVGPVCFYTPADAARARLEHLEEIILFWPYMAVVDAFQQWVYLHVDEAVDGANCDAEWGRLWDRFMPGVDWTGLEQEKITGWHRKLHIHLYPFYYVEYGLAQLGAVQVWANALRDQPRALAAYRRALSLGGTVGLPDLYAAAGARLAFDAATLRQAVDLVQAKIEELEVTER